MPRVPVLRGDVPLKLAVPRIVALKPRVMRNRSAVITIAELFAKLRKRVKLSLMKNIPPACGL